MDYSISEIISYLGVSRPTVSRVDQEYMDGGQKTSDRENCKGQLALTVRGERRLRHIVSETIDLFLNARHLVARIAWAREYREWRVKNWKKRVAWSEESRF
ncbi:HTH_Tnp_Tc3_2 domain-containing protein [Trichonephila clavipes]|nr:HTH_Tnp_Tc3_2 domain-containing protein [Trichonephila clavipes]